MELNVKFWQENNRRRDLITGYYEYVDEWWWRDDDCEEPVGPFETKEEAETDYVKVTGRPLVFETTTTDKE